MFEKIFGKKKANRLKRSREITEFDKMIGNKIREARNEAKVTQDGLAYIIGVTYQQLQKYEKGINRITAGRLLEISKSVGKPIEFFFEGNNNVK
jgi:transcriptional regulator with XRE-family HTH domain